MSLLPPSKVDGDLRPPHGCCSLSERFVGVAMGGCRPGCGEEAETVVGFFVMRSIDTLRRSPSAFTMTLLSVTATTFYGP